MGGSAGTGEGIEDKCALVSGNFQNKLNQAVRLWCIKSSFAVKYRKHFLFGFIGMSGLSKCPKVCRQFSTHIFEVYFSGNAAFASFGEEKARPLSTVIYRLCLLRGYFE